MNIKCPLCGFENEEGSKFCKNCNESLSKQEFSKDNPYYKKTKNRIEKEERIRAEAKFKVEKEIKQEEQKKQGTSLLIFLGVIIIFAFIIFSGGDGENEKETQPSSIYLNASVRFTGTQFIIENNDNFDWLNVKMEVNGSFLKSGFILETDRMKADETYTVGALQFAKKDGTRFNPITYKPQKIDISCDTLKGEDAFWSGGWE